MKATRAAALFLTWLAGPLALAESLVTDPRFCPPPGLVPLAEKVLHPLRDIVDFFHARDSDTTHFLDAYFLFDARPTPTAIAVTPLTFDLKSDKNAGQVAIIKNLFGRVTSLGPGSPTDMQQWLGIVQAQAPNLSTASKLMLLSMLGDSLLNCYEKIAENNYSGATYMNQLIGGLEHHEATCGVCRDIHTFLAQTAAAMGFKNVGEHTGFSNDGNQAVGRHAIAHYMDPVTGEYYVQNYSGIVNTHQKTLTEAIDISTRVLGPLTGLSYVESKPGVVHAYQPRTTRYWKAVIEDQADFKPDSAVISFKFGNVEKSGSIQYQQQWGDLKLKGFGLVRDYAAGEGHFTMEAVGMAVQVGQKLELNQRFLSEIGYFVSGTGGLMNIHMPTLPGDTLGPVMKPVPGGPYIQPDDRRMFWDGKVKGYARLDKVTGHIEFEANEMDYMGSDMNTDPLIGGGIGVTYQIGPGMTADYTRHFVATEGTVAAQDHKVATDYDKVSVVVNSATGRVYVYNRGEVYLFQGAENMSAIGVHDLFKSSLKTEQLGTFSVMMDFSKIVSNPSGDPFYQSNLAAWAGVDWSREIVAQALDVGGQIGANITGNQPYYLFEDPSTLTPETEHVQGVTGMAWLHGRF